MSNEEYTHRAEWPEKSGIIETHYGTLPKMGLTAEELTEGLRLMQANIVSCNVDVSQSKIPQGDYSLDTAGYLKHGSPHIPFEKSAVKSAEDVHDKIMLYSTPRQAGKTWYQNLLKILHENKTT